jgi:uncharacterized protein YkvS
MIRIILFITIKVHTNSRYYTFTYTVMGNIIRFVEDLFTPFEYSNEYSIKTESDWMTNINDLYVSTCIIIRTSFLSIQHIYVFVIYLSVRIILTKIIIGNVLFYITWSVLFCFTFDDKWVAVWIYLYIVCQLICQRVHLIQS